MRLRGRTVMEGGRGWRGDRQGSGKGTGMDEEWQARMGLGPQAGIRRGDGQGWRWDRQG